MLADRVIEKNSLVLRNLNINDRNIDANWTPALTGYAFYNIPYEIPLAFEHKYYYRCIYKYTTTNQSPTWVTMYSQDGMRNVSGASKSNPVAGTEYTLSGIASPDFSGIFTIRTGTIYNGDNNAINGVSSYVKEVIVYDVTELLICLKAYGIATTDSTAKTWCDNNLGFVPRYTDYDITNLVTNSVNKVFITKGDIIADNFIECDGMKYYSIDKNIDNYMDNSLTGIGIYNNEGNGAVTHTRVDAEEQNSPFWPTHKYVLKITTNGAASPGAGGMVIYHQSAANKIFVEKIVAKIPVGYSLQWHCNGQGDGANINFISASAGTGDWEEYTVLYKCGSSGTFSTGGHLALKANSGYSATSVTWYVAYANNCDITGKEYLKYYTALPNKQVFKEGSVYVNKVDTTNIFANGDGSDSNFPLPSGWEWDASDVAGNAKRSIVQPVGGNNNALSLVMPIDSSAKYKISYWVKCKADMTSFLTAILLYTNVNGTGTLLTHPTTQYVTGTKTRLAQDLKVNDTIVYLNSVNKWVVRSNSRLGFRSSDWVSYNDVYTYDTGGSAGCVSAVDSTNNTITLSAPYNGAAQSAGKTIVESFAGAHYPYPITKIKLPTDNTWKYVEGYFGADNSVSDGAGGEWTGGIPLAARSMKLQLNLYNNDGTVPVKFSDIRIEQVSTSSGNRYEKKIQFKNYN